MMTYTHTISTLIFFIFINVYAYNFFILNICLLYFTYIHFPELTNVSNVVSNSNGNNVNNEFLLFFSDDILEYTDIDYNFDIGNYFVDILIDNTPMLFVFSINYNEEYQMKHLTTNKINSNYNNIYGSKDSSIHFKYDENLNKVSVVPDTECVITIKVIPTI